MKNRAILFAILSVFFCVTAAFAETKIVAEVDKVEVTTDDVLTYKLTITSSEQKIPAPKLPEFDNCNIISRSNSSKFTLFGGNTTAVFNYTIILNPKESGTFEIKPSQVKIKKQVFSSEAFTIKVKEGSRRVEPEPKPDKKPVVPEELFPESDQQQVIL